MAQGRGELKALLERHGIRPRRSLGQNFLGDPNLVDRIVRTAGVSPGDRVVEVGAGTGTLSRALAESGATVLAFEVDNRLAPILAEVLAGTTVDLRLEDVTKVDLAAALGDDSWTMVANLPYNVGTPLVLDILRRVPAVRQLVVMVQREVAERFVAAPGSKAYGLPSIICDLYSDVSIAFTVPPEVFYPMPEIESAVVRIVRKESPPYAEKAIDIAGVVFQQRRKMVRRSLAAAVPDPAGVLAQAGISETARPEQLSSADFLRLAEAAQC